MALNTLWVLNKPGAVQCLVPCSNLAMSGPPPLRDSRFRFALHPAQELMDQGVAPPTVRGRSVISGGLVCVSLFAPQCLSAWLADGLHGQLRSHTFVQSVHSRGACRLSLSHPPLPNRTAWARSTERASNEQLRSLRGPPAFFAHDGILSGGCRGHVLQAVPPHAWVPHARSSFRHGQGSEK